MSFRDRNEAGRRLATELMRYKDQHPVVLALPRGGVPVAAEVAAALEAPLDLVLDPGARTAEAGSRGAGSAHRYACGAA